MTNPSIMDSGLPDPGPGRNPPRYRRLHPNTWGLGATIGIVVAAFLVAGALFFFFSSTPTILESARTPTEQGTRL